MQDDKNVFGIILLNKIASNS